MRFESSDLPTYVVDLSAAEQTRTNDARCPRKLRSHHRPPWPGSIVDVRSAPLGSAPRSGEVVLYRSRPRSLLLSVLLALTACAHLPPPMSADCALPAYRLAVSKDGIGRGDRQQWSDPELFRRQVRLNLSEKRTRLLPSEDLLILSGGSQHGAFGAGFFAGLGERPGGVPDYTYITGVSAGALNSTLILLANAPVRKRKYPPYMAQNYSSNLEIMVSLFSVDRESRIIQPRFGGELAAVRDGSLATFDPLRSLIFDILTDETLSDIQAASRAGRHLLVGVTGLDDGSGYAIDLTKFVDDELSNNANRDTVRTCYIDALLASSSVPPGMPPVSLALYDPFKPSFVPERGMYIDGGARFGVFWNQLEGPDPPDIKTATMLINGTLSAGSWEEFDRKGTWSVLSVAKRSSGILINQVYRFSVDQIEDQFRSGTSLREAFISSSGLTAYGPEVAVDPLSYRPMPGARSCGEWLAYDRDHLHPLEFHPHYMQCLVAYGRMRGRQAAWNRVT